MSCCNGTEFSDLKHTWTKSSSLVLDKWDPYPELQNPLNCYGANTPMPKENYSGCCGYDSYGAGGYSNGMNQGPPSANLLNYSKVMAGPYRMKKETFLTPCCQGTPYMGMNKTWGTQKPFTL